MARIFNQTSVSSNGSVDFDWLNKRGDNNNRGSLFVYGTFGGGTVSLLASPDGGTTYVPVKDSTGTAITFTANNLINFELYSDPRNPVKLRLTLSGAAGANLSYTLYDMQ